MSSHFTRGPAQYRDVTADRVGNDSVSSTGSRGQPTTSKSSKNLKSSDDKLRKAPAVPPPVRQATAQAPTAAINIPGQASSQGQIDPRVYTATPSVSTSVSSVATSQQSMAMMSGGNRQANWQDGPSRKSLLDPSDNRNFCVEPETPGTGPSLSQPVTGILKSGSGTNAPPAQPSNRHIGFASPSTGVAPLPYFVQGINEHMEQQKTLKEQEKRKREREEEERRKQREERERELEGDRRRERERHNEGLGRSYGRSSSSGQYYGRRYDNYEPRYPD